MPHPRVTSSYRVDGATAFVALSRGRGEVAVDLADAERVAEFGWDLGSKGYVIRTDRRQGTKVTIRLHRWLIGLERGDRRQSDHVDGNPLNCRRSNLRVLTPAGNAQNRKVNRTSASGIRGVGRRNDPRYHLKPWYAHLRIDGHQRVLGYFATKEEAAERAAEVRRQHMPFAIDR